MTTEAPTTFDANRILGIKRAFASILPPPPISEDQISTTVGISIEATGTGGSDVTLILLARDPGSAMVLSTTIQAAVPDAASATQLFSTPVTATPLTTIGNRLWWEPADVTSLQQIAFMSPPPPPSPPGPPPSPPAPPLPPRRCATGGRNAGLDACPSAALSGIGALFMSIVFYLLFPCLAICIAVSVGIYVCQNHCHPRPYQKPKEKTKLLG